MTQGLGSEVQVLEQIYEYLGSLSLLLLLSWDTAAAPLL